MVKLTVFCLVMCLFVTLLNNFIDGQDPIHTVSLPADFANQLPESMRKQFLETNARMNRRKGWSTLISPGNEADGTIQPPVAGSKTNSLDSESGHTPVEHELND